MVDSRKRGIEAKSLIPKDDLEPVKDLTNQEIADIFKCSIYRVKRSLIEHGLYRGKYYAIVCGNCEEVFHDFIKTKKYCSNGCKHSKQTIWNKGLTKEDSEIIMSYSHRMMGNKLGKLVDHSIKNTEEVFLPVLQKAIKYDKNSKLEKEWLLKIDNCPGVTDIKRSGLVLNYKNDFDEICNYYPDYEVLWETGVKWLVEIKGVATDKDYQKIESVTRWAKENRYDFKIITTGMIKKDTWNSVFSEYRNLRLPSPEWVCMNWAATWSKMSTSPRLQVGAVITSLDCEEVFSYGFNGLQKGAVDLPTNNEPGKDGFIHAEENALLKLKTKEPAKIFITHMPCINCARRIINSRTIKEVYYLMGYRDAAGVGELMKAGIKVYHFQITNHLGVAFNDKDAYQWLLPVGMSDKTNDGRW